ncbi:MAG: ion transporter [Bacteroidales bacterium]|nr:ion transporter [Bacteroidales bacterium]
MLTHFSGRVINHRFFKGFIFILILVSAVIIGIETYPEIATRLRNQLIFIDKLIIAFFTIEITLKIIAEGKRPWNFFKDPWNVFDFLIVAICLIPAIDTHFVAAVRIVRVLRILRMITLFPKLRLLIGALLKSIPSMGYVILLLIILFYVYAVVGVFLFGDSDPVHFGNLHHTMITLFKVITLEGWTDIMNTQLYGGNQDENAQILTIWPFAYFASFILIGAMIIMNLFIGVIMNSMEESQNELSKELQEIKLKGKDSGELYMHIINRLDELRNDIQKLK